MLSDCCATQFVAAPQTDADMAATEKQKKAKAACNRDAGHQEALHLRRSNQGGCGPAVL